MKLQWHGRLSASKMTEDSVLLLSERETLSLSGRHYRKIIHAIEGNTGPAAAAAPANAAAFFTPQEQQILRQLMQQNLIEDAHAETSEVAYFVPDFMAAIVRQEVGQHQLILLSQQGDAPWWRELLPMFAQAMTWVVVDDYLDPRLQELNQQLRHEGRSWVLLSLNEAQANLGPVFRPEDPRLACWHCLAERLQWNQPARLWATRQAGALCTLPIPAMRKLAPATLQMLAHELAQLLAPTAAQVMVRGDFVAQRASRHGVVKRPQCPNCGDIELMAQQMARQILLQDQPCLPRHDGGFRVQTAEASLARLQHVLDPITGVLACLEELTLANPDAPDQVDATEASVPLVVHKSVFFVSPSVLPTVAPDPFVQVCLGKGISRAQSRVSALCEGIERYNAQYRGDEPSILALPAHLPQRAVLPTELVQFSPRQYAQFSQMDELQREKMKGVLKWPSEQAIPWTPAWSLLHQEAVYLPTSYCFANTPFDAVRYVRWGSNGCAAGNSLEEALLQGCLELVERDAVAIWWYNKIARPAVDLSILPVQHRAAIDATIGAQWEYWVLDLTHDFGIAVMAAIGRQRSSGKFSFGFGCHLLPMIAIERALSELCQLIPIRQHGKANFNFDDIAEEAFLLPAAVKPVANDAYPTSIYGALQSCLERARSLQLDVIAFDYSRADIPLHTVNVSIPGLCHIWPQFACQRLYQVPLAMGWRTRALREEELNPMALLV